MASTLSKVTQVSLPLPRSMDTKIFVRMEVRDKSIMLFLTTAAVEDAGTTSSLGSLVYAISDRYNPAQPMATVLYSVESTVEPTTRLAKMITRKTGLPVYVSNSISLASTVMGGSPEEELEAFTKVVEVVAAKLPQTAA
ncbi:hypothetical protein CFO_g4892 [Ceratocystis platani]|uniref:Proteasome assembly chaperone 3 n=1 Tax=Ceratocystis fimbriata f. sp. platani TaxID=88771 RepID=A0A0F8BK87_CERFI|nr:hypothetical protein CFO_g4892 [Ceratocystis platani]